MLSSEHLNQNTSGIKSLSRYLTPDGSLRLESNAERMAWLHFMSHVTANAVCDQDWEMHAKFTSQIYTINKSLQQILTYILLNPKTPFSLFVPYPSTPWSFSLLAIWSSAIFSTSRICFCFSSSTFLASTCQHPEMTMSTMSTMDPNGPVPPGCDQVVSSCDCLLLGRLKLLLQLFQLRLGSRSLFPKVKEYQIAKESHSRVTRVSIMSLVQISANHQQASFHIPRHACCSSEIFKLESSWSKRLWQPPTAGLYGLISFKVIHGWHI